jgi:hypothetical protein
MKRAARIGAWCLAAMLAAAAGYTSEAEKQTAGQPPAKQAPGEAASARPLPAEPAAGKTARLRATVFEVHLAPDRIADLDAQALAAKSGTPADLQAALEAFGPTKVLYQADQAVNLLHDQVTLRKDESFVTGSRMTESGQRQDITQTLPVGFRVVLSAGDETGPAPAPRQIGMNIEAAALGKGPRQPALGADAMVVRTASHANRMPVVPGRPIVMVAADAASPDEQGQAVAYVVRTVIGDAPSGGAKPAADAGPTADPPIVRFQGTVYEVHVPAAQAGQIDPGALAAKAASAAEFQKSLAQLGRTQPLWAVDQPVGLDSGTIRVSARVPMVTGERPVKGGAMARTVQYIDQGVIFAISGTPAKEPGRKGADVRVTAEAGLAVKSPSETAAPLNPRTAFRNLNMAHNGPVEFGRPFVMLWLDASAPDADGQPVAFICRGVLSEVRP